MLTFRKEDSGFRRIDAPEIQHVSKRTGIVSKPGQPYGEKACRALESKVLGKEVKVQIIDIGHYRRMVAVLYLGDTDINRCRLLGANYFGHGLDLLQFSLNSSHPEIRCAYLTKSSGEFA